MRFDVGRDKLDLNKYCIWLPKGLSHGPLIWYDIKKPFIEMAIMLNAARLKNMQKDANLS
jgi:hypothetical protein